MRDIFKKTNSIQIITKRVELLMRMAEKENGEWRKRKEHWKEMYDRQREVKVALHPLRR